MKSRPEYKLYKKINYNHEVFATFPLLSSVKETCPMYFINKDKP